MATKQDIGFSNPAMLIAPDIAVQQQQLDRQRAIAAALQQQSLEPIDGGRGAISWTQGLAKIAQALGARAANKRADVKQADLARQYATALRAQFGGGGGPASTPTGQVFGGGPNADGSMSLAGPSASQPVSAPADTGQASQMPQTAPAAAQQAAQPQQPSPWSLTGNPDQEFSMYAMNPDTYGEAVIASHAPTDFAKLAQQAGITPNSPLYQQLLQGQIAKQNYIAPINGRPGSTIRDPNNPSRILGYDMPTVEGAIPEYGPNGEPRGYRQAPGATAATAAMEAAKTGARAGTEAHYGLVQVFDEGGQAHWVPKDTLTGGPMSGGGTPAQRGPGGAGPISSAVGSTYAAAPPGTIAARNAYATDSARAFGDIQAAGADVPNRMMALREMGGVLDNGLKTGPTLARARDVAQKLGIPGIVTDNVAELNKWASQYSARSAAELGLSGSDTRVNLTIHANPNGSMPTGALRNIVGKLAGIEAAKAARANMAGAWAQNNPADRAGFERKWREKVA